MEGEHVFLRNGAFALEATPAAQLLGVDMLLLLRVPDLGVAFGTVLRDLGAGSKPKKAFEREHGTSGYAASLAANGTIVEHCVAHRKLGPKYDR